MTTAIAAVAGAVSALVALVTALITVRARMAGKADMKDMRKECDAIRAIAASKVAVADHSLLATDFHKYEVTCAEVLGRLSQQLEDVKSDLGDVKKDLRTILRNGAGQPRER